ncbi:hypothetical protein A2483_00235 [Candidatus Peregrinibacteria bacterium RIFOXYC2_FULL_33_13]|nr:MAG: hypothetical protein UR27_C0004G0013 [Candidatus Peregrinibacteria bacterium GW2011_GWA2_33_10]KKP41186.1 MAG: hypothetical protein UR30_C0001G0033 [Candidatus Peregrinibacteria bacterium GW2011_GWC2_33_13]OGJ50574.1 MAG: hypothetical protein A2229_02040 [Candidatus Peregrinibacteria bacterium RIFOXYA2_FULL_33_7]OGJ53568.1 MAG: hypothetical protein A2483_00235 [Candidatus Peregrinibacteria bacterium RIFOXYC2_FULL_33_13]
MIDYLATIISYSADILSFLIFIRIIIYSWLRMRFNNFIDRIILDFTDPILDRIKNFMPSTGMIDFSPMIAILGLSLISELAMRIAMNY